MMEEVNKYFIVPNKMPNRIPTEPAVNKPDSSSSLKSNRKTKGNNNNKELKNMKTETDELDNEVYDKEKIKFIQETLLYPGEDVFPKKLVHRPEKGVVWGLGGELLRRRKSFFEKGKLPEIEEIVEFLEVCIQLLFLHFFFLLLLKKNIK